MFEATGSNALLSAQTLVKNNNGEVASVAALPIARLLWFWL